MTEQTINRNIHITEELLCSAKAGDREALTALYEGTHQEIYRTIHAMVRDEDLTMDIQQDTYIHAFTHLDQLRNTSSFLPWLRRIAVNEAKMQLRKKKPMLFTEYVAVEGEVPEIPDEKPESSPELALDRKESSRLVSEILDELSDLQRMLVGMYYYEGIPMNQIAEDLNINQSTARSLLSRSRKKIEAAVRNLEKKGIRLYGLAPIPFLVSLLRQSEPAAKMSGEALPEILSASGITKAAAVHVGRRFLETALGKVLIGVLAAGVVSGGVMGYRYWQDAEYRSKTNIVLLEEQETDSSPEEETEPVQELLTVPEQPPKAPALPVIHRDPKHQKDDTVSPAAPRGTDPPQTEPAPSEPQPTAPPQTEPAPTESAPAQPDPAEPMPTQPETDPAPSTPVPDGTEPTVPDPTESETMPVDTAEDLTPEPSEVDTPEDFFIPPETDPEPTEPEETDPPEPHIVECSWNKYLGYTTVIYDIPWETTTNLYVISEGEAVPTFTSDAPDVATIEPGFTQISMDDLTETQNAYCFHVTSHGPGTAHISCFWNGEEVQTLTVENPEYPDVVLEWSFEGFATLPELHDVPNPEAEPLFVGTEMVWSALAQGVSEPELISDHPEVIDVVNCVRYTLPTQSWIQTTYTWSTVIGNPGTATVSLRLNGEIIKSWTIHAVAAEEEPNAEENQPEP